MSTLDAILDDLATLVDGAMWAHAHGYSKAGRGLDAEHGADLSRTEAQRESGETYDLDIGDNRCRVAYERAVRAISRADVLTAAMLLSDGVRYQLAVDPLTDYAFPSHLRRTANRLRWRLGKLDADKHAVRLGTVRSSLDRAVRGLSKALDHGPTSVYTAHKDALCRTCEIRPRPKKRAECNTCTSWRHRHNGASRPVSLDADSINQARAAKVRRMDRDEGWGVA